MNFFREVLCACLAAVIFVPLTHAAQRVDPATAKKVVSDGFTYSIDKTPTWVRAITQFSEDSALALEPMHYVLIDDQTIVDAKGASHFHHIVRSINSPAGLEKAAQIQAVFDPQYQTLVIHQIDVLRNGLHLNRLGSKTVRLNQRETQLERLMIDGRVTASFELKDLRVGDKVEYAYTITGINPVLGGKFAHEKWVGNSVAPISQFRYRLLVPSDRTIHYNSPSAYQIAESTQAGYREIVFSRRNVPLLNEDRNAPFGDYLDELLQFSEFANWGDIAQWGVGLFGNSHADQTQTALRARSMSDAGKSDMEKTLLALDFVQKDIRYFGTEIGVNSHKPVEPDAVLMQRYGDCKDKTNLLIAMLKEMGIEAVPILVNTYARNETRHLVPSPFAFNHVVARVVIEGKEYVLDATRSFQVGNIVQRQSLGFGEGLVLKADSKTLSQLPHVGSADQIVVDDVFKVADFTKDVELLSTATWYGDYAENLRGHLAGQPREKIDQQFASEYVRLYGQISLTAPVRYEELPDRNAIRIVQTFVLPDLWRLVDQRTLIGSASLWNVAQSLNFPNETNRKFRFRIASPGTYRHNISVEFPQDVYRNPDITKFEERNSVFQFSADYAISARRAQISSMVTLQQDFINPAQWPVHMERLSKVRSRYEVNLRVPAMTFSRAEQLQTEWVELEARNKPAMEGGIVNGMLRGLFGQGEKKPGPRKAKTAVQAKAQWGILLSTAVIESNRLNPKLRAQTFAVRGDHWDHFGEPEKGAADFAKAIELMPNEANYYAGAAIAAFQMNKDSEAQVFLEQALSRDPTNLSALRDRARLAYFKGDFGAAQKEYQFLAAQSGHEDMLYASLWLYLSASRTGDNASQAVRSFIPKSGSFGWPYPVLQTLLGELALEQAEHAATSDQKDPSRLCELYFFIGEKYLLSGDEKRARSYFRKAVDTDVVEFIEHSAAKRRLASLPD